MYVSCGQSTIHVVDANYGRLDNSMCVCCGQSTIHIVDANYGRLDNSMCVCCGQSTIHVVDANYGRLDNSMCADQLGTPNDNCRQDVACIVEKWYPFSKIYFLAYLLLPSVL